MGEAAGEAVCMTKEEQGIEAARRFYGALLKLPSCGGRLFHTVLDMELAESKQRLPHKKLKAIFEVKPPALQLYDPCEAAYSFTMRDSLAFRVLTP